MHFTSPLRPLLLLTALGAAAGTARAEDYTLTDLSSAASGAHAVAINDTGEVAGSYDGFTKGFVFNRGAVAQVYTQAFAPFYQQPPPRIDVRGISDFGTVVGSYAAPGGNRAFMKYRGNHNKMIDLGTMGSGYRSEARDVNNWGRAVGKAEVSGNAWHAFLYEGGVMRDFGTFGGLNSEANAINESGQVTGCADTFSGQTHAFRYTGLGVGGTKVDLGTLGGSYSCGVDLNSRGWVAGNSSTGLTVEAFLHDGTQMLNLGAMLPPHDNSYATGIDAGGNVVGTYWDGGETHAFLYRYADDTMELLDDSMPEGVRAESARDVNDTGQIVVGAYLPDQGYRDVLLTPVLLHRVAYAFAGQPTTARYTPPAAVSHNGSGGPIVIDRVGTGTYEVRFHDLDGWTQDLSSAISVSTHASGAVSCSSLGYTHDDRGTLVATVGCIDLITKVAVDAAFHVMVTGNQSLAGPSAFLMTWYGDNPTVQKSFAWNAVTPITSMSVTRIDTGTYDVLLGTGNTARSAKLVTARGYRGGTCLNARGLSGGLRVKCYDEWGLLTDMPFSVAQVAGARSRGHVAFARANLATTASYTPSAETAYNSTGGAITATRQAVGRYTMTFAGMAEAASRRIQIQVMPFLENLRAVCNSTSWTAQGDDLIIGVECRTSAGALVDTRYDVLALE